MKKAVASTWAYALVICLKLVGGVAGVYLAIQIILGIESFWEGVRW